MRKNINSKIATLILRTQNCSDGGKGKTGLVGTSRKSHRDNHHGYDGKDQFMLIALSMIARGGSDFKYCVTYGGITPYLVYFEVRIRGVKYQVSFHSYNDELERFMNKSFRIKWDHGDSQKSAVEIYRYFCPKGQYAEGVEI